MKKLTSLLCLATCLTTTLGAIPMSASADDNLKYGTMNIPYDEFYKAEGIGYDVDAVTSATTSKWKNENLTAGTYNQVTLDEKGEEVGGTILGVTYYVALTNETLEALGENNYNFTEIEEVPSAYKEVSITDGVVSFSEVKGETTSIDATATVSTSTAWGDYLVEVETTEDGGLDNIGTTYGVIFTTTDGDKYAMRHLENIWRGEFAWSCGITTQEPHGNTLTYEDFIGLSGSTIDTITYITENGYFTVDIDLYIPKKFTNTLEVATANINDGKTTISSSGFPEDYVKSYTVDGLEVEIVDNEISFKNAQPGSYTLTVSDVNNVYADVTTSFVLSTDKIVAIAGKNAIVKADGVSDEEFSNFLSNLSTVTIGETSYNLSGRGSVAIINTEDGTVNLDITQGMGDSATKIFAEDGTYNLVVTATGYENPVNLTVTVGETTEPSEPTEPTDPITPGTSGSIGESDFSCDTPTNIRGDINYDGKVNVSDLVFLRRYLLHMIKW